MSCYRQTCTQIVTGRNLKYLRALQIVQNEEYMRATDLKNIIRNLYEGVMRDYAKEIKEQLVAEENEKMEEKEELIEEEKEIQDGFSDILLY